MTTRAPNGERDGVYYWDTVRFLVEGIVFKLPRYQFIVGSEYFAQTYLQDTTACPTPSLEGSADEDWDSMDVTDAPRLRISTAGAIQLEGVTAEEFRVFLKLLFPIHSSSTTLTLTKPEWLTVLTLSTRWHFLEFRKLAIAHLDSQMVEPIEMIIVGRREYVSKWLMEGYGKLVSKKEVISEGESDSIGDRTAVKLYIVRHELASIQKEITSEHMEGGCVGGAWLKGKLREKFAAEYEMLETEERRRRTEVESKLEEEEAKQKLRTGSRGEEKEVENATQTHADDEDAKARKALRKKAKKIQKAAGCSTQKEVTGGQAESEGGDSTKVTDPTVVDDTRHGLTQLPDSSVAAAIESGGHEEVGWSESSLTEEQKQRLAEITGKLNQVAETFKKVAVKWDEASDRLGKSTATLKEATRRWQEGN